MSIIIMGQQRPLAAQHGVESHIQTRNFRKHMQDLNHYSFLFCLSLFYLIDVWFKFIQC